MKEIDWQSEAEKWKRMSRKNEAMNKVSFAEVKLLKSQLAKALTPRNAHAELAALTKRINENEREFQHFRRLMQEVPAGNRDSARPTAQHHS